MAREPDTKANSLAASLPASRPALIHLTKPDPCPQVRNRAHLLLAVIAGPTLGAAARATGVSAPTLRHGRDRFLAKGEPGLADRPRGGRPSRLTPAADYLLDEALDQSPMDQGYPVGTWGLVDLADLLRRRCGIVIGTDALARHLTRRGYGSARPRHDLTHRQDAEAVESAKHTRRTLEKGGLIELDTTSSTWMHAPSTRTPTWQRSGNGAVPRGASPRPGPTNG